MVCLWFKLMLLFHLVTFEQWDYIVWVSRGVMFQSFPHPSSAPEAPHNLGHPSLIDHRVVEEMKVTVDIKIIKTCEI